MSGTPLGARFALALQRVASVSRSQEADTGKYRYRYTDLSDVLAVVKEALEGVGLALAQPIRSEEERFWVETLIIDVETGETMTVPGIAFRLTNDPQAVGSAITYARRYNLTSLFALTVVDDDGRAAHLHATKPPQAAPPPVRSEAETQIRQFLESLTAAERQQFAADFREHFGSGLAQLPVSRHDDALWWSENWEPKEPEAD